MSQYQLMSLKHAPSHCLAPGLFRSLGPGERKKSRLDLQYDTRRGEKMQMSGPEPLGADDMRVLQGLLAMARVQGKSISKEENTPEAGFLRSGIELKWDAIHDDLIVVRSRFSAIAREIGYKSPRTKQPPAKAGGFGLRTGSPDTRRLNDASMAALSGNHHSDSAQSGTPDTA
jgi:hypothetical protein